MSVWAVLALLGAAAQVSGGSYGAQPASDFVIENFLGGGPLLFCIGVVLWIVGRSNERNRRSKSDTNTEN